MMLGRETMQPIRVLYGRNSEVDELETEASYVVENTLKTAHDVARKNSDIAQGRQNKTKHMTCLYFKQPTMKLHI